MNENNSAVSEQTRTIIGAAVSKLSIRIPPFVYIYSAFWGLITKKDDCFISRLMVLFLYSKYCNTFRRECVFKCI